MSIINDALKKTQMSFKKPKKKEEKPKEEAQNKKSDGIINVYEKLYKAKEEKSLPPAEKIKADKKSRRKKPGRAREIIKTVLVSIFFLASLAFSYKFLSGYGPLQDYLSSKTGKRRSSRHIIKKYVPTKKKVYKPGNLVLNGISAIDGQKVALINDEIYQIGETVNGKTITAIANGQVELQGDGKAYILKVR